MHTHLSQIYIPVQERLKQLLLSSGKEKHLLSVHINSGNSAQQPGELKTLENNGFYSKILFLFALK